MSHEKVISVVQDTRGFKKIFYRDKQVAMLPDEHSVEELSDCIEAAVDELVRRKDEKIDNVIVPALSKLLHKIAQESYTRGYNRQNPPPHSLFDSVLGLFK